MEKEGKIIVNQYSLASYYVEVMFNEMKLSNATCFFTNKNGKLYLITNWHVVSGRDADTFGLLDSNGAIPNILRVYLAEENEEGIQFSDNSYINIKLYDEEGNKLWYELKKNDRMVDIVAIPMVNIIDKYYMPIEDAEEPFNELSDIEITSEIYIIGFPFGKIGGEIPIWKKASVASEPELDIEGMPYYYADTATKPGMSGSPVILYEDRPIKFLDKKKNKFSSHITKLVGVYSGRIGANTGNKYDAQLGRVWKVNMIQEIINIYEGA